MDTVSSVFYNVISKSQINVTWEEADGDFAKYIVNCTSPDGNNDEGNVVAKEKLKEYICQNLTAGTEYLIMVTTYLTADNQETSTAKTATTSRT